MRAVVQRVNRASVSIESLVTGDIGRGYLILLGVGKEDNEATAEKLWQTSVVEEHVNGFFAGQQLKVTALFF